MVLIIDFGNERLAFGAADGRRIKWFRTAAERGGVAVAKALRALGFDRRPPAMVAVMLEERRGVQAGDRPVRRVSWSTVRAAVAAANTLAFAWNIPVVTLRPSDHPDDRHLSALVDKKAFRPKKGEWAAAVYSGEPNITRPKKTLKI